MVLDLVNLFRIPTDTPNTTVEVEYCMSYEHYFCLMLLISLLPSLLGILVNPQRNIGFALIFDDLNKHSTCKIRKHPTHNIVGNETMPAELFESRLIVQIVVSKISNLTTADSITNYVN